MGMCLVLAKRLSGMGVVVIPGHEGDNSQGFPELNMCHLPCFGNLSTIMSLKLSAGT